MRHWRAGALRRDLCLPIILSLWVLWFHSNLLVDDADHGGRVLARRPVECGCRCRARHRGRFSHAGIAFNGPGSSARTFHVHRAARRRSARGLATATLECAPDSGRGWDCADAIRLGCGLLCSREIFCRQ